MENLVLLAHLLTALAIIGLILLQQGKGAEMGASFGSGASQTLFGATGSGNFFAKLTGLFAAVFFVTSMSLAVFARQKSAVDEEIFVPELQQVEAPAAPDEGLPQIEAASEETSEDVLPEVELEEAPVTEE